MGSVAEKVFFVQSPVRLVLDLHIDLRWPQNGPNCAICFSEYYLPAELYAELIGRTRS